MHFLCVVIKDMIVWHKELSDFIYPSKQIWYLLLHRTHVKTDMLSSEWFYAELSTVQGKDKGYRRTYYCVKSMETYCIYELSKLSSCFTLWFPTAAQHCFEKLLIQGKTFSFFHWVFSPSVPELGFSTSLLIGWLNRVANAGTPAHKIINRRWEHTTIQQHDAYPWHST